MRPIYCQRHQRIFRGHGTTRVYRKLVFNFCAQCWHTHRTDCEDLMVRAGGNQKKTEVRL